MSLSKHEADELLDLLNDVWDHGATAERLQAIEDFVQRHGPDAGAKYLELTALNADIASSVSSARAFTSALSAIQADDDARALSADDHQPEGIRPHINRRVWHSRLIPVGASIAAAIVIAAGWFLMWRGDANQPAREIASTKTRPPLAGQLIIERPLQPVACIVGETDAIWSREYSDKTLKQGQRLQLVSGVAQLSLACGADIVLQAPCQVTLVADNRVELTEGALTAQVADWATGFVVETKGLRVTDLGARFTVAADPTGVTESHILEGSVLAEPTKIVRPNSESTLLSKGQAIRVNLPESTIDLIAAKETRLVEHLSSFRPLRPIEIWNTGLGQSVGSEDPRWMVVGGPPANGPYPRPAIVTAGDPVYLDNMPDASQWISVSKDHMAGPDSTYTFETRFDLTGYDLSTVRLVGLFLVDDAINSLELNGNAVPFERWQSTWDYQDFQRFRAIEFNEGFIPGENTVRVELYNSPSRPEIPHVPNPVGMRVEWQAFGCEDPSPVY
ncbi:MAG: hypothetical protein CMJ58_24910 [Planctomycetaceae bacterium]|nr:hypothetical protein [Planctomycetaceae bacterium]